MIIAGDPNAADTQSLVASAQRSFCPNLVLIVEDTRATENTGKYEGDQQEPPPKLFREVLEAYGGGYSAGEGGQAAAYVCFNNSCSRPVYTTERLRKLLG